MIDRLRRMVHRTRAISGLATGQLINTPSRSLFAIIGVTLAVLAMTSLAGIGLGVVETGERQFDAADRDLWVSGGPATFTTQGGGGFENSIDDSHAVAADIQAHENVSTAAPIGFQTVYIAADGDEEFQTTIATGVSGGGSSVQISEGDGLSGDQHYADGTYDGPKTHEVVIDEQTATAHNVSVGDSLHLGGTLSDAREQEYTVVGISPTFSQFLGEPTVTLHLSELQQTTGTTATDPATFIVVTAESGADVEAVQADLQERYPEYDILTNREQLDAVLESQAHLLAGGAALVGLALVAGLALTANILTLLVHQQRRELAALKAIGVRSRTLVGMITGQGFLVGLCGGLIGVGLTLPAARALNVLGEALVGFEGLVQTPHWVLIAGFSIAVGIGILSAVLASHRIAALPPLQNL